MSEISALDSILTKRIQEQHSSIKLLMKLGSSIANRKKTLESDIDYLILIDETESDHKQKTHINTKQKKIRDLRRIFFEIVSYFRKRNVQIKIVPTFHIEQYIRYIYSDQKPYLVHIVVYYDADEFFKTEPKSVCKSMIETGQVLYGSIDNLNLDIELTEPFHQRIKELEALLLQTYLYSFNENIKRTLVRMDLFYILEYCIRFITLEYLVEIGYQYIQIIDREKMLDLIKTDIKNREVFNYLINLYKFDVKVKSLSDLEKLVVSGFEYIDSLKRQIESLD